MADSDGDGGADARADAGTDARADAGPEASVDAEDDDERRGGPLLTRRRLLAGGAVGAAGAAAGYWWYTQQNEPDPPFERVGGETDTGTTGTGDGGNAALALAQQYAPALRFGAYERWYPTDPRRYSTERDGETVVDGFAALDGYTRERREEDALPAPTVFYNVLELPGSALTVVQYWMYSVFDQFAVNFHWHDWELFQVFVDTEDERPVLLDASAHARSVPNNEYLVEADESIRIGVLSEVGSHSSTTAVNSQETTFQRLPLDGDLPDVTNAGFELADLLALPFAYGLPRDEGGLLPFVMPELDDAPLYDHPDLPNVDEDDLVPSPLTVRSLSEFSSPPEGLPRREHDLTMVAAGGDRDGDVAYDLVDVREVEHIAAFEGPQLSFEFAVPNFAEDAFAEHLTSVGIPWSQPRFENPLADVTDPGHRRFIEERYISDTESPSGALDGPVGVARGRAPNDGAPTGGAPTGGAPTGGASDDSTRASSGTRPSQVDPSQVQSSEAVQTQSEPSRNALVAVVEEVESGSAGTLRNAPEGAREVFGDRIGVSVRQPRSEPVVRVDGEDSVAVPTVGGVARFVDVEPGDRELLVNGAGYAPHAQRVPHTGELTLPGGNGKLGVVAREHAVKVRGELEGLSWVRVDEDFAGSLHYHQPVEDGRFGVYLHREGAYSLEVQDDDGQIGVFRVKPADETDDGDGDDDTADTDGTGGTGGTDGTDGSDDDTTGGNTTDGNTTDDGLTDGSITDETRTDGNTTDGNTTDGTPIDGTTTDGTTAGGDLTDETVTAGGPAGDGQTGVVDASPVTVELATGKAPITEFLDEYLADTAELSRSVESEADLRGSATRGFENSIEGLQTAVAAVERNAPAEANRALGQLRERLASIDERIERQRGNGLPDAAADVLVERVETADYRAEQAIDQPL